MSLHERSRAATLFHALVAVLLLVAGGALFGWGIWLRRTDNGAPAELQYVGTDTLRLALDASWGAIGAGAFLALSGVVALLALARQCVGGLFRVLYIVMAVIIAAVLLAVCVVASVSTHTGGNSATREFVKQAWQLTAASAPKAVCDVEKRFQCRGFDDRECMRCPTGLEGAACEAVPNCVRCDGGARSDIGCYEKIVAELRRVFRPVAIIAGILASVVIIDIVVTCCL